MTEQKTMNEFFEAGGYELMRSIEDDENYPLPFDGLSVTYEDIDFTLFSEFGERIVAPFVSRFTHEQQCAQYVYRRLIDRWKRYAAAWLTEYNPGDNYAMTENESITESPSGKDTTTETYTDYKEVQKYGHSSQTTTNADIYGADSTDAVPADETTSTTSFYQDEGQAGDERTISGEHKTEWEHKAKTDKTRGLTRTGNIGVKTTTEMLAEDESLWQRTDILQTLAHDIAEILTIPAYL